jgi:phospholipid/cholesterol/gamma-HCH transport system substrate-binding protein
MSINRSALVGAFVLCGLLLFAIGLFMVGDRRMLFADRFEISAEFEKLAGVQPGGTVRVAGMDAGEVLAIQVPPGPGGRFRVRMRIREDLHQIVRTDSVATIQSDGIVGNKFVQVDPGSAGAPEVPDGGTIAGKEPFDMADLMAQMSDTVRNVNATIVDVRGDLETALASVTDTVGHADQLIQDVGTDVKAITAVGRQVSNDAAAIVRNVRNGQGTLGRLITDDQLYARAAGIAQKADATMDNIRELSVQARGAITDLRSPEGPVQGAAADFRQTLGFAREAMQDLSENAEALKRNWFFRGFFNRRGYFDLDDLTAADYRSGVLAGKDRVALRIWIASNVLFAEGPGGAETLTEGGRARLDGAMAEFLRYEGHHPLVVEGYGRGPTRDARYLRSHDRAAMVKEYLLPRFHLDANRVGAVALGEEAEGSPVGQTWDGVAITLFVPPAVIADRTARAAGRPAPAAPAAAVSR